MKFRRSSMISTWLAIIRLQQNRMIPNRSQISWIGTPSATNCLYGSYLSAINLPQLKQRMGMIITIFIKQHGKKILWFKEGNKVWLKNWEQFKVQCTELWMFFILPLSIQIFLEKGITSLSIHYKTKLRYKYKNG